MIIDREHPLAPYVAALRKGEMVPFERLDTQKKSLWRIVETLHGTLPSGKEATVDRLTEEPYDELRYMPHVPQHLRPYLHPSWKVFDQRH